MVPESALSTTMIQGVRVTTHEPLVSSARACHVHVSLLRPRITTAIMYHVCFQMHSPGGCAKPPPTTRREHVLASVTHTKLQHGNTDPPDNEPARSTCFRLLGPRLLGFKVSRRLMAHLDSFQPFEHIRIHFNRFNH